MEQKISTYPPKPHGTVVFHVQQRLEFPRIEDVRVRNVLEQLRLKYERQSIIYDPKILHRNDIRPVAGHRGSHQGGYHTFAFKVYLRNGNFFFIDFWGPWVDIKKIPFRNPNWYQKYLKQRKIEFCKENNFPFLILQRRYRELEDQKFIRLFIVGLRNGIIFAEPLRTAHYRAVQDGSLALSRLDHNDKDSK